MKVGDLYRSKRGALAGAENLIVAVVRSYNHADIDPECPESVAIVTMVEVQAVSGETLGQKMRYQSKTFRRSFEKLEAA